MSASMYDIDRSTHLKILCVGSAAAMIVVALAANARSGGTRGPTATTAPAVYVTPPQRRQIEPPRKMHPIALAQSHLIDAPKSTDHAGLSLPPIG